MATLTLSNGTVLTRVIRASCLDRVAAIPLGSYVYSQGRIEESTDRRADCTGWVSYVWGTPKSGPGIYLHAYNTASFYTQHVIARIDWADLLPGDAIGFFAANSPGNGGHAAIWMGGDRRPDGVFDVSDHGSGMGPKRRWVKWNGISTGWLHPDHLAPWRYVGIIEDGDDMTPAELLAYTLNSPSLGRSAPVGDWLKDGYVARRDIAAISAKLDLIAAKIDIDPGELAAIEAAAKAGVVASADDLAAAIVARLPEGATKDDMADAVRDVLLHGAAPESTP